MFVRFFCPKYELVREQPLLLGIWFEKEPGEAELPSNTLCHARFVPVENEDLSTHISGSVSGLQGEGGYCEFATTDLQPGAYEVYLSIGRTHALLPYGLWILTREQYLRMRKELTNNLAQDDDAVDRDSALSVTTDWINELMADFPSDDFPRLDFQGVRVSELHEFEEFTAEMNNFLLRDRDSGVLGRGFHAASVRYFRRAPTLALAWKGQSVPAGVLKWTLQIAIGVMKWFVPFHVSYLTGYVLAEESLCEVRYEIGHSELSASTQVFLRDSELSDLSLGSVGLDCAIEFRDYSSSVRVTNRQIKEGLQARPKAQR